MERDTFHIIMFLFETSTLISTPCLLCEIITTLMCPNAFLLHSISALEQTLLQFYRWTIQLFKMLPDSQYLNEHCNSQN